ncbi:MAG: phosphoribosylglycinamide formyltransferase [Pseudomonadota bacterium]
MQRKRVAVFISGRGSNMSALIAAASKADYPAEISLVLADSPKAAGLDIAKEAGIPAFSVDRKTFPDRATFESRLDEHLTEHAIEIVCLAGFMRILSPEFVERWRSQILNIHPSLLPAFPGLNTHEQAIKAGVKLSGCTVHVVGPGLDDGPIIAQSAVPVHVSDTADTLASRILKAEHVLYPMALRLFASGAVKIEDDRVVLTDAPLENEMAIFSPPLFADQV